MAQELPLHSRKTTVLIIVIALVIASLLVLLPLISGGLLEMKVTTQPATNSSPR